MIGINTLKMSGTGSDENEATVEGLGFAIPMGSACFVVNDIIAYGEFRGTPSLGITVTTVAVGSGTALEVYSVIDGSGADEAGMQAGDIITAANGQTIRTTSDLMAARRRLSIGDVMHLTVERDGQTLRLDVELRSDRSFD